MGNENNIEEKSRDKKEEYLANINDNNQIEPVKNEENKEFGNELKIIENVLKELGYKCEIEFDENQKPIALVIYDKDNQIISYINKEKGLQILKTNFLDIESELQEYAKTSKELTPKEMNKLIKGTEQLTKEEISKENAETKENVSQEEAKTNPEDTVKEELGPEYKVLSTISYTGNKEILDKVYATEGIVGRIYKVENTQTGEISLAGMRGDGEVNLVEYRRIKKSMLTINVVKDDNSIKKETVQEDMIQIPGDPDKALVLRENEAFQIGGLKTENPFMIRMDEKPSGAKQTTKEQDEIKAKSEKMGEISNKLDEFVEKGYITENKKNIIIQEIMNNGRDIDDDMAQLEKIEKEKEKEEEKELYPEGPWDRADIHLKRD